MYSGKEYLGGKKLKLRLCFLCLLFIPCYITPRGAYRAATIPRHLCFCKCDVLCHPAMNDDHILIFSVSSLRGLYLPQPCTQLITKSNVHCLRTHTHRVLTSQWFLRGLEGRVDIYFINYILLSFDLALSDYLCLKSKAHPGCRAYTGDDTLECASTCQRRVRQTCCRSQYGSLASPKAPTHIAITEGMFSISSDTRTR